ncbi:MAG: hypothetical protein IKF64_02255 [Eubacterium sp.]|nr:hypothetical protein [Eubacterium sp.]
MSISYKGYNAGTLTFKAGTGLQVGYPVKINSDGEAVPASNNDDFIGVCTAVRDIWASVQTDGYIEMPYSGTLSAASYSTLVSDADHKVKANSEAGARVYKLISLDTTNKTVGFIL